MRLFLPAALLSMVLAVPAVAATEAETDRLLDALGIRDLMVIMSEEGIGYGQDIRAELLGPAPVPKWDALVDVLYDTDTMYDGFRAEFAAMMADSEASELIAFFESDLGGRIVALEIEGRRAMLDADIEAAAGEKLAQMRDEGDPRLELLQAYVETNDLIEMNVVGAMNANYAFYAGLSTGNAFEGMTEAQILSDVWSQEAGIRVDTIEWIYSFLTLAYRPLSDADIEAYIDLSSTDPGKALNRALFGAFDEVYVTISEGLGRGAARLLAGQDI